VECGKKLRISTDVDYACIIGNVQYVVISCMRVHLLIVTCKIVVAEGICCIDAAVVCMAHHPVFLWLCGEYVWIGRICFMTAPRVYMTGETVPEYYSWL
jgi:hypothetical protein